MLVTEEPHNVLGIATADESNEPDVEKLTNLKKKIRLVPGDGFQ